MKGTVTVDSEAFYKFINDRLPIADYSKAPSWRKPIDRASRVSKGGVAIARLQARRNFVWNPGSAKWILKSRLTCSVVAIVRYGFISIVPIWIGVRRLPAHQSKAIEHLLRIPSSRFQIGLCYRQSRLPA